MCTLSWRWRRMKLRKVCSSAGSVTDLRNRSRYAVVVITSSRVSYTHTHTHNESAQICVCVWVCVYGKGVHAVSVTYKLCPLNTHNTSGTESSLESWRRWLVTPPTLTFLVPELCLISSKAPWETFLKNSNILKHHSLYAAPVLKQEPESRWWCSQPADLWWTNEPPAGKKQHSVYLCTTLKWNHDVSLVRQNSPALSISIDSVIFPFLPSPAWRHYRTRASLGSERVQAPAATRPSVCSASLHWTRPA